jgi:hypothetical protein
MFVTKSNAKRSETTRSWYGEPQHEEDVENGWERGFYGEPTDEGTPGPVEFVPEVEPHGRFEVSEEPASRPLESPKRVASTPTHP